MFEKLKNWLIQANDKGLPIPLLRDKGTASYTATMMMISFAVSIVLLGGKAMDKMGGVDYENVLMLLGLTSSLYLGRKYQKGKDGMILGDSALKENTNEQEPPV
jgi:hypothetical protein